MSSLSSWFSPLGYLVLIRLAVLVVEVNRLTVLPVVCFLISAYVGINSNISALPVYVHRLVV